MAYLDPSNPSQDTQIGDDSQPNWFTANAPPAAQSNPPASATGDGPPTGGSVTDPAYVNSLITYYSRLPGADPSLAANPGYWFQKILSGELGADQGYIVDKMQNAWKTPGSGVTPPATPRDALGQLPVPSLNLPGFKQAPAFTPTSMGDVLADPGYQFRTQQGQAQLQQSAAARGVLNSGGTLKDILDYGQNAASQEYQNVDARRRSDYQTNYQTQYVDPYTYAYQAAKDAFALPNDESLKAFGTISNNNLGIMALYPS